MDQLRYRKNIISLIMKHRIKCYGNTCPNRNTCELYTPEAEEKKTEPDDKPGVKCEFYVRKGGKDE